jgi:activator of HSP90 ATPase
MLINVYTIRDEKVSAYLRPFLAPTHELMRRSIASVLMDGEHEMAKFPRDFTIYEVGVFDDQTGLVNSHTVPKLVNSVESIRQMFIDTHHSPEDFQLSTQEENTDEVSNAE